MGRIVDLGDVFDYGDLSEEKVKGVVVEGLVATAEEFVERYCGRRFSPDPPLDADGEDTADPVTKNFTVSAGETVVRIPDLRLPALQVALNGQTMFEQVSAYSSGYRFATYADEPTNRIYIDYPTWYGQVPGLLSITGRWGWLDAPEPVKHAVMALTMRMFRERDAAWADSVASPDGSVLSYFRQMPASIQGGLDLYRSGSKVAVI